MPGWEYLSWPFGGEQAFYCFMQHVKDHNSLAFMQYFADRDIFCAGRVMEEDLQRVAAATGGTVQTSVNNIIDEVFLMLL